MWTGEGRVGVESGWIGLDRNGQMRKAQDAELIVVRLLFLGCQERDAPVN